MSYTTYSWHEWGLSESDKVIALNHAETQYDELAKFLPGGADEHDHDDLIYLEAACDAAYFSAATDGDGSGLDAWKLDGLTYSELIALALPLGAIGIWSGTEESIPDGFAKCDGNNGTINLINKFLVCSGGGYSPGDTGGVSSVSPTAATFNPPTHALTAAELPPHSHGFTDYYNPSVGYVGNMGPDTHGAPSCQAGYTTLTISGQSGSTADPHDHNSSSFTWTGYYDDGNVYHEGNLDNRPPYYALLYIQKIV
jgi:hypothetical protein